MNYSDQFEVRDIVRLQLNPEGTKFRYEFNLDTMSWYDLGYGEEVEGKLVKTPASSKYIYFNNSLKVEMYLNLVHPAFNMAMAQGITSEPGWPVLVGREFEIPKCQCGSDSVYGESNSIHSNWCDKYLYLKKENLL